LDINSDSLVKEKLAFPVAWQAIGWGMVCLVVYLTLTPKPPVVPGFLGWDKAQHFVAYAGLMWWYRQAFSKHLGWIVFMVVLGVGLECIQGLTDYRFFDYYDMVANTIGVALGIILAATPLGQVLSFVDRTVDSYHHG
jgi:hypothetical protein